MSSPPSNSTETGSESGSGEISTASPKRGSALTVVVTIGLLGLLVWALTPRRVSVRPAPPEPLPAFCAPSKAEFVPSNLIEVPGIPLESLPEAVKNHVLLRLNMEPCTCGCVLSLAQCRAGNPQCPNSPQASDAIVKEERQAPSAADASRHPSDR